jgi:hypothetical protein
MLCEDLLLDRDVSTKALRRALAAMLSIPELSVQIVADVANATVADHGATRVLVERTSREGEFPLQLSLYLRDAALADSLATPAERLARVQRLSQLLGCSVLLSDDSLNPFSWLRIAPSGVVDAVALDPDRLDSDEFVVTAAHPVDPSALQVR